MLSQVEHKRSWCPIDRYAGGNEFWNALRGFDRERALHTVFSVALRDPVSRFRVTWNLEEVLDQASSGDILVKLALETEEQATLVAESITSAKEGFWEIAFRVLETYPSSRKIWDALTRGMEQEGQIIEGPYTSSYRVASQISRNKT